MQEKENPFKKLKQQLDLLDWPNVYLYKIIVPNNSEKIAEALALFPNPEHIETHDSKNKKYVSISIKMKEQNADSVIKRYQQSSKIEGAIML